MKLCVRHALQSNHHIFTHFMTYNYICKGSLQVHLLKLTLQIFKQPYGLVFLYGLLNVAMAWVEHASSGQTMAI